MKLLTLLFLLISCGQQNHAIEIDPIEIDDSEHTIDGEAYQYVVVQFDFIQEIKQLCEDLYPEYEENRAQKVAQCTFDNLSILDTGLVSEFNNEFCNNQESYDQLTPEEQLQVDQLCEVLWCDLVRYKLCIESK